MRRRCISSSQEKKSWTLHQRKTREEEEDSLKKWEETQEDSRDFERKGGVSWIRRWLLLRWACDSLQVVMHWTEEAVFCLGLNSFFEKVFVAAHLVLNTSLLMSFIEEEEDAVITAGVSSLEVSFLTTLLMLLLLLCMNIIIIPLERQGKPWITASSHIMMMILLKEMRMQLKWRSLGGWRSMIFRSDPPEVGSECREGNIILCRKQTTWSRATCWCSRRMIRRRRRLRWWCCWCCISSWSSLVSHRHKSIVILSSMNRHAKKKRMHPKDPLQELMLRRSTPSTESTRKGVRRRQ